MTQLVYSREELLRSHDYAKPHVVNGQQLHGGFDAAGKYIPPRILVREPAIEAWAQALRSRGGEPLEADSSLLGGMRFPSEAQLKLLVTNDLEQSWWNTLTITGMIEGRGRMLAEITFPDLQDVIWEDVSEMGIAHLNKGLLYAHGVDEGGELDKGIGGHDVMWYQLRDLAFGPRDYPMPEVPERIGREDDARGEFREIDNRHEQVISFLLNLLLIEFRAEIGFAMTQRMLRDPDVFPERRAECEEAAEIVGRIRADEEIHVESLKVYLGELRNVTLKTVDGGRKPGRELIDPFWQRIVQWATVEQPKLAAEQQREVLTGRILAHRDGKKMLERFDALADAA